MVLGLLISKKKIEEKPSRENKGIEYRLFLLVRGDSFLENLA
jgi:hypothetical protein